MGDFRFSFRHGDGIPSVEDIRENEGFIYKHEDNYYLGFKVLNPNFGTQVGNTDYDENGECKYIIAETLLDFDVSWNRVEEEE